MLFPTGSRKNPSMSHHLSEEDFQRSAAVILENVNAVDQTSDAGSPNPSPLVKHSGQASNVSSTNQNFRSPRGPRSETFSFPPPSERAPSPPQCDSSVSNSDHTNPSNTTNSYQLKMLRKTQSNPIHSSSSLPDLFSDETVYETVSQRPAKSRHFVSTNTECKKDHSDAGEVEIAASGVFDVKATKQMALETTINPYVNPNTVEQRELGTKTQTPKTRVSRLASAPLSLQDYDEPLDEEMRARFYSYRGMRLPSLTNRVGALKRPMPLPPVDNNSNEQPPDSQFSENGTDLERSLVLERSSVFNSVRISERRESELESTLDSIEEIDENESLGPIPKVPEVYLEPVLSKTKENKSQ